MRRLGLGRAGRGLQTDLAWLWLRALYGIMRGTLLAASTNRLDFARGRDPRLGRGAGCDVPGAGAIGGRAGRDRARARGAISFREGAEPLHCWTGAIAGDPRPLLEN